MVDDSHDTQESIDFLLIIIIYSIINNNYILFQT